MMQREPHSSSSPSFGTYSSNTFAQIAARVIHELQDDTLIPQPNHHVDVDVDVDVDVSDDFEFSFVSRYPDFSPVSADDIFYNGQIRPIYPLFDGNLLNHNHASVSSIPAQNVETRRRRLPLGKLMFEERETVNDNNDLDGVAVGTYCVWNPSCKKSISTESSSKRWKLRDLLLRSHGDGKKESLLFLGPAKKTNRVTPKHISAKNGGAGKAAKSVGFLGTGNGLDRSSQPFSSQ